MNLTRYGGSVLCLSALLIIACEADPGEDAKPAFAPSLDGSGAKREDAPVDSTEPDDAFACNAGYTPCSGVCVNELTDTANCGGCGATHACTPGATCSEGQCTIPDADAGVHTDGGADTGADAQPQDATADRQVAAEAGADARAADAAAKDGASGMCTTCSGCCDPVTANCHAGSSNTICGSGGSACQDCTTLSMTCVNKTCQ